MTDIANWIGILIQTCAILGGIGWFVVRVHLDLRLLIQGQKTQSDKISKIEDRVEKLSEVLVDLAKQDARLTGLENRVQEISNRQFKELIRD